MATFDEVIAHAADLAGKPEGDPTLENPTIVMTPTRGKVTFNDQVVVEFRKLKHFYNLTVSIQARHAHESHGTP